MRSRRGHGIALTARALVAIALLTGCTRPHDPPSAAERPGVVLRSVMYAPVSGDHLEQFLVVANEGGDAADVSGWCLGGDVAGCFPDGTVLDPGGTARSAASPDVVDLVYGGETPLAHEGALSMDGPHVTLTDRDGQVVFDCTLSAEAPWPESAAGEGDLLHRTAADGECGDPSSWAGRSPAPPPASADAPPEVEVIGLTLGDDVRATELQLRTTRDASVRVEARIDAGPPVIVHPFLSSSADGATAAWTVELPTPGPGGILRYRVLATTTDPSARTLLPKPTDRPRFLAGIRPDDAPLDLPTLRWWMDPGDFEEMTTEHLTDKEEFRALIALDGEVHEVTVHVKGKSSTALPKKKFAFDLPKGTEITPPGFEHPVDSFDLQDYLTTFQPIDEHPAWKAFEHFGIPTVQGRFVRVHKSTEDGTSAFYGTYYLRENHDRRWRERHGMGEDDGDFFKEGQENKTDPDAGSVLADELIEGIDGLEGDALRDHLYEHLDIPAFIDFMAVSAAAQYDHWGWHFNVNQFRDARTGRWRYLPLDLDFTFDGILGQGTTFEVLVDPSYDPSTHGPEPAPSRLIETAAFSLPELREMYFRRLVTVQNELAGRDLPRIWYDDAYQEGTRSFEDDHERWAGAVASLIEEMVGAQANWIQLSLSRVPAGYFDSFPGLSAIERTGTPAAFAQWWTPAVSRHNYLTNARHFASLFDGFQREGRLPPDEQPTDGIRIAQVVDGTPGERAIVLRNEAGLAVDVSGWTIPELDFVLPGGAVIPTGACAVVVADDTAGERSATGRLVFGEVSRWFDRRHDRVTLVDPSGRTIDQLVFTADARRGC